MRIFLTIGCFLFLILNTVFAVWNYISGNYLIAMFNSLATGVMAMSIITQLTMGEDY